MKKTLCLMALLCLLLSETKLLAQDITQSIRGVVIDLESKTPLIGVNITISTSNPILGSSTDLEGRFRIEDIPIGRHDIEISYIGYETAYLNSILLNSGKELVLEIELEESISSLNVVEITAENATDKTKALNTMATLSSRTFSVEETSRYAAASFDPARMAQNYAGVSIGAGSDLYNEIIVRGNSPGGVLWRLEGIEIPNPNHFGFMGNSGGAISMLSSTTLSNSDFYTGAFPAEFGNATSGVFDLNMRSGNNEKRETSLMIGALGVEVGTEGPFSKNGKASYLLNYRYSTLALLQATGINPTGDVLPTYQDLSFKVNVPTKKGGTFALFGLGGDNLAATYPEKDSLNWESQYDREGFEARGAVGTIGLSHRYLINDKSYLRTVAIISGSREEEDGFRLDDAYSKIIDYDQKIRENTYRVSSLYHLKINPKISLRLGGIYSYKDFNLKIDRRSEVEKPLENIFNANGETGFIQAYAQSKFKLSQNLLLNMGVHFSQITLNNKYVIEPRMALKWSIAPGKNLSIASGLHSKMEHLSLYSLKGAWEDGTVVSGNEDLAPTKSIHNVIAYDHVFNPKFRLKAEAYYQHLFDVTILNDPSSTFSIINAFDAWDYFGLNDAVQEGTGRNVGLDLTLERFFADQYYFMITGSLYDSKYKTLTNKWYNTRFNGNYQLNFLGGKEFSVGKNDKNILGVNGKFLLAGGNRYTAINLLASIDAGDTVKDRDNPYTERGDTYYRFDIGFSYKINTNKMTHTILFDIQNVTNRENIHSVYFNEDTFELETETQTGFFPFFNYRMEF